MSTGDFYQPDVSPCTNTPCKRNPFFPDQLCQALESKVKLGDVRDGVGCSHVGRLGLQGRGKVVQANYKWDMNTVHPANSARGGTTKKLAL